MISNTSGLAGIAHWVNRHYDVPADTVIDKHSDLVKGIKAWVDTQYENGRVTVIANEELLDVCRDAMGELGMHLEPKE